MKVFRAIYSTNTGVYMNEFIEKLKKEIMSDEQNLEFTKQAKAFISYRGKLTHTYSRSGSGSKSYGKR